MMNHQNNNQNIQWFRTAVPYINAHQGRTFVIQFDGEAVKDKQFPALINDIAILHNLGVRLILVHGARPQINASLRKAGVKTGYSDGMRITDNDALPLLSAAIADVQLQIETQLSRGLATTPRMGKPVRVVSGNFVLAKPYGVRNGVDFGHTGEVRKIDHQALQMQLAAGNLVLLSPLGYSLSGEVFNLRAEDVATAVATAVDADKLIFMLEVSQLLDAKRRVIRELSVDAVPKLLQRRKQLPEPVRHDLQSAVLACRQGVARVHLLSRLQDGSLLQELYTRDGVGTLITNDDYEDLRAAAIQDVGGILNLIEPLEIAGVLVKRSREQLELEIDQFVVIERDGLIIACAALYPYIEEHVAELACIAVHPDYTKQGRGDVLFEHIEKRAQQLGIKRLFVLTTQTAQWFLERGFVAGELSTLPLKKRELYNYQRNAKVYYKNC